MKMVRVLCFDDSVAPSSTITGLEGKIAEIVRGCDSVEIVTVVSRIKGELQLFQQETQKFSTNKPIPSHTKRNIKSTLVMQNPYNTVGKK